MNLDKSAGELALEIGDLLFLDTDIGNEYVVELRADNGAAWNSTLDVRLIRRDNGDTGHFTVTVQKEAG